MLKESSIDIFGNARSIRDFLYVEDLCRIIKLFLDKEIEDIYRILYVLNNNISKAIETVKETMPESPIRNQIIDFIEASDKGVIRGLT